MYTPCHIIAIALPSSGSINVYQNQRKIPKRFAIGRVFYEE